MYKYGNFLYKYKPIWTLSPTIFALLEDPYLKLLDFSQHLDADAPMTFFSS